MGEGPRRAIRPPVVVAAVLAVVVATLSLAAIGVLASRSAPSVPVGPGPPAGLDATAPVTPSGLATASGEPSDGAPVPAAPVPPTTSGPSIDAYRGLGAWVDIYDSKAWRDPAAAVRNMARHGVRTLYIETGNSSSKSALFDIPALQVFIREAHARGMRVVAWYLPELKFEELDYARAAAAIGFRTEDGQAFDSFALDIESGAVRPVSERNLRLASLSARIRELAGPAYPLGGIIPSPVGLKKTGGYWRPFPYAMVAGTYDVILPMGYYTYHGNGPAAAYSDATGNIRILRSQPGCAEVPVHLIGGLAGKSSAAEVREFVRGARESGCIGAGIYDWATTTSAQWSELGAVAP